jgi:3'(2'), 5'-bisphosphate nucleotidase
MRGTADIFVRISPTNSWDTAAGHCLLNAIGGEIVDFKGQPLRYEFIGPIWLNPSFIAVADKAMLELIPFSKLPSEHSETTAPLHSLPSK